MARAARALAGLPGCAAPLYVSLRSGNVAKQQSLSYPGNGGALHCVASAVPPGRAQREPKGYAGLTKLSKVNGGFAY